MATGSERAGTGRRNVPQAVSREAPLTIRLKEPAGSTMQRDVMLHVDCVSGTVAERLARVVACLAGQPEWRALSDPDRKQFQSQLSDWLARNLDALNMGTLTAEGGISGALFAFQQSDPLRTEPVVPPRREAPPAAPPPAEVPDRIKERLRSKAAK